VALPPDILAVDAATQAGLARGRPGDKPRFATVKFSGEDRLAVAASVIRWISRLLTDDPPELVYIEKPMPIGAAISGKSSAKSIIRLNTIYDIIGGACLLKGIKVIGVEVQRARGAFIGEANVERDEAKRRSQIMAHLLGWESRTLDEADAAALWYWACCCEAPRIAAVVHPGMHAKVASIAMANQLGAHG
jgi:hypothetical protein